MYNVTIVLSLGNVKVVKTEASGKVSEHVCMVLYMLCMICLVLNQAATLQFEDTVSSTLSPKCNAKTNFFTEVSKHSTWNLCKGNKLKRDAQSG